LELEEPEELVEVLELEAMEVLEAHPHLDRMCLLLAVPGKLPTGLLLQTVQTHFLDRQQEYQTHLM
jgi:hypothetical protein